jgi:hypothetical protein
VFLISVLWLASSHASEGAELAAAESLFIDGAYEPSAERAAAIGDAGGFALAARALLAHATTTAPSASRVALVERAEVLARSAIEANPDEAEGHLQLVIALGHLGRHAGILASQFDGLAQETKRHIRLALEIDDANPWAHAVSGGWHIEIVRHDPLGFASLIYGARRRRGMAQFATAIELDPNNMIIRYQFALALLELNSKRYGDEAAAQLQIVTGGQVASAYEAFLARRARHLLALQQAEDRDAFKLAIENFAGLNLDEIPTPPLPDARANQ